jgi:hypothetical protein
MTVSALRHSDTARSRFRVAIASRGLSSVRSVSSFADTWNSLRRPVPRHKQDDTSAAASTGRHQFSSHGPTRDGTPRALVNGETVAGARSSWAEIGWTKAERSSPATHAVSLGEVDGPVEDSGEEKQPAKWGAFSHLVPAKW